MDIMKRVKRIFIPAIALIFVGCGVAFYMGYEHQLKNKIAGKWCTALEFVVKHIGEEVRDQKSFVNNLVESEFFFKQSNGGRTVVDAFSAIDNKINNSQRALNKYKFYSLAILSDGGELIAGDIKMSSYKASEIFSKVTQGLKADHQGYEELMMMDGRLYAVTAQAMKGYEAASLLLVLPVSSLEHFERSLSSSLPYGYSFDYRFLTDQEKTQFLNRLTHNHDNVTPVNAMSQHKTFDQHEMFMIKDFSHGVKFEHFDPLLATSMFIAPGNYKDDLTSTGMKVAGVTLSLGVLTITGMYMTFSHQIVRPLDAYTKELESYKLGSDDLLAQENIDDIDPSYKSVFERVRSLVETDSLTGISNRTYFLQKLKKQTRSMGNNSGYLLYIDLDKFKNINDTLGHDVGDELLVKFSSSTRSVLASAQGTLFKDFLFARLGGDEFAIYVYGVNQLGDLLTLIDKIEGLFDSGCFAGEQRFRVGISLGVVEVNRANAKLTVDSLIMQADRAMYVAKQSNEKHYFYNSELEEVVQRESLIEQALLEALDNDGFNFCFMPIVRANSLRLRGFELLIRCPALAELCIGPDEFIPCAERVGLIRRIDRWVIEHGLAVAKRLQKELGEHLIFSINISSLELMSPNFSSEVDSLLKTVGIKPESVEFEVTETAFAPNDTKEVGVLTQLKALGIHLAIDDFGTGFTSFNQLIAFPFDTLKIDKTFVDQILNDSSSGNEMVDVLYRLAQSYSLKVVAEGVETNKQVKVLSELGCNYLQGYYFSEPVPEGEVVNVAKRFRASVSRLA